MRFSHKIFYSFFLGTLLLGTFLILVGHKYVVKQTTEEFITRYQVFSDVMSDTITSLDHNSEALMLNAAKVIAARDLAEGPLSNEKLKAMRSELNVTHLFVLNNQGKYIRSTNEDASQIPNAFSFCAKYKDLATGGTQIEATPIIHPNPEPKPYKFLFIPGVDHKRILEVGLRVDFAAKTLTDAIGSDKNIISMSLFEPNGGAFGRFTANNVDFKSSPIVMPTEFPQVIESADTIHFLTKVTSSHPKCCQCDVSGTSRNGEYYYVLDAEVSKKELKAMLAKTTDLFCLLAIGVLALSLFIGRFLSKRLVRNIEIAVDKIRSVKKSGDLTDRVSIDGKDEVAFLTREFDRLLESHEKSQKQLIESEKIQAKVQLAREIAHNIRSPVIALEMMLPKLMFLPEKTQKVFKDSAREIKALSDRLTKQADSFVQEVTTFNLKDLLESEVENKLAEYSSLTSIRVLLNVSRNKEYEIFAADPTEVRAVISNLINNSVESYANLSGEVIIDLSATTEFVTITVSDRGCGIQPTILSRLGKSEISVGKTHGKGIGLVHAYKIAKDMKGSISIASQIGLGTTITFSIPKTDSRKELNYNFDNNSNARQIPL